MIKKLRMRFILLTTVSLLLLLVIIEVSSSVLTYRDLASNADRELVMIAETDGRFPQMLLPDQKKADHPGEAENPPVAGGERSDKAERPWTTRIFSADIQFESRFFTVLVSPDMEIIEVNAQNFAMTDESAAAEYAGLAMKKKSNTGFVNDFRYLRIQKENDTYIVFLDCGRNLFTFRSSLFINCVISLAGLLVIFVFIVIFSGKMVRPVSESYEKQKQFISMAGHEIKTPITIIDADAEILSMEIGEDNEWLQDICAQTRRMAVLTNDLLSLSRMDEGRQQFAMIDFPISDVVGETVQSFQTLARSKGRNIDAHITPMLSYCGDEAGIRQITGILLDNTIKYTRQEADGTCADIKLTLEKKNHNIFLSVKNSADPVSDEQLRRFFDRFYRTEQSRKSAEGGYGLGLSIAKSIVEAHRGKIAASIPEPGFVQITVTLPAKGKA